MNKIIRILAGIAITLSAVLGQAQGTQASTPAAQASEKSEIQLVTSDTPDILRETQLGVRHPGYTGLIWWIPYEFWVKSAVERGTPAEKAEQTFAPLKNYTIICVFAAKVGSFGALDFVSAADIEKNVVLRDADGKEYSNIQDPSQDAKNLAAIIKPVLAAAIGKAGENMQILFFPGRTKEGALIADASHKGQFFVVVRNIVGDPETVYLWRLPLTSVLPAKYCPVGKERVNLNWEYCPWHGVALNASSNR